MLFQVYIGVHIPGLTYAYHHRNNKSSATKNKGCDNWESARADEVEDLSLRCGFPEKRDTMTTTCRSRLLPNDLSLNTRYYLAVGLGTRGLDNDCLDFGLIICGHTHTHIRTYTQTYIL